MIRKVTEQIQGQRTKDGAGVSLVRVLGNQTADAYDPFLMLDAFDSANPDDFKAGFPMHPHRGIETVTFIAGGSMTHRDHLGTEMTVRDGEAQWLTAGSGAFHEEMPGGEHLIGTQLWLNLPAKDKMTAEPAYHGITRDEIREFPFPGGKLRLLTGTYQEYKGWQGKYLPLDYYDIHLDPHAELTIDVEENRSAFVFTLLGDAEVSGTSVREKTAARLGTGDQVTLKAGDAPSEILFMSSVRLDEPVAWYGPIVMNSEEELYQAFKELNEGTFIKKEEKYDTI